MDSTDVAIEPNHDARERLNQIIQRFYIKAASVIIQSRTPLQDVLRDSQTREVDDWFQLKVQKVGSFMDDLHLWRICNISDRLSPSMIIETYFDTAFLRSNQSFAILDELDKSWNVIEYINQKRSLSDASTSHLNLPSDIILERWKIWLNANATTDSGDFDHTLPSVYKMCIVIFRSLYATARLLPTWKFLHGLPAGDPWPVKCRILQGNDTGPTSTDGLSHGLYDSKDPVTTKFSLGELPSPAGSLAITVEYRTNCAFKTNNVPDPSKLPLEPSNEFEENHTSQSQNLHGRAMSAHLPAPLEDDLLIDPAAIEKDSEVVRNTATQLLLSEDMPSNESPSNKAEIATEEKETGLESKAMDWIKSFDVELQQREPTPPLIPQTFKQGYHTVDTAKKESSSEDENSKIRPLLPPISSPPGDLKRYANTAPVAPITATATTENDFFWSRGRQRSDSWQNNASPRAASPRSASPASLRAVSPAPREFRPSDLPSLRHSYSDPNLQGTAWTGIRSGTGSFSHDHGSSNPLYQAYYSSYSTVNNADFRTLVPVGIDRMSIDNITNPQPGGFQCTYPGCSAQPFQTQYLLNSHANIHSSNRPHFCPVKGCPRSEGGKGFKRKNEMIRHGLVHESPGYTCPFCPDREHRYPRPDNLQRHVRVHHMDKDKDDPVLRDVLAQRPTGPSRGRRRHVIP